LTERLEQLSISWSRGPARNWMSLPQTVRWLERRIREFQPDVIQSMLFHANLVTAIANRGHRKPHFGGARVGRQPFWRRQLQRWASRRMEKLVCVSQRVAEDCRSREGVDANKLVVIPNGVLIEGPSSQEGRSDASFGVEPPPERLMQLFPGQFPPFFLFVGRLTQQKGIPFLMDGCQQLLEKLPDHHLLILGDGPLRERLEHWVKGNALQSRMHLLGWQPEAHRWMPFATALLLPSAYEGMPNVLLEAMKASLPVVAFDVEGTRELLGDDGQQIVRQGDVSGFTRAAHQLAVDKEHSHRLGQKSRQRVCEQFRLEDQMKRYEQLYLGESGSA
jgi:glycosyltransferase involved in cell wall biosynthesis